MGLDPDALMRGVLWRVALATGLVLLLGALIVIGVALLARR